MTTKNKEVTATMQEQLLELVKGMRKDGFDFLNDAAVFKWQYEEEPEIIFELAVYDINALEDREEEETDYSLPPDLIDEMNKKVH